MLNNNNLGLSKDWPVNANLDLALEILQPIKVKQTLPNQEMVNRGNECEAPKYYQNQKQSKQSQ